MSNDDANRNPNGGDSSDQSSHSERFFDDVSKADPDLLVQMEGQISELKSQVDEANSRAVRTMADFQNYQRRALQNELVAKAQGVGSVVLGVVNVIDHFDVALNQDLSKATVEQVISGVRVIREELIKTLSHHGVSLILPQPNEEFVPGRHEAIMQQPAKGIEAGRVVSCFQAGYLLAGSSLTHERVIRPAKVSVSPVGPSQFD